MINKIKRFFIVLLLCLTTFLYSSNSALCDELCRIKPISFDLSESLIFIPIKTNSIAPVTDNLKYTKLENEHGVELEFTNAGLDKQPDNITFSQGNVKECRINKEKKSVKIQIIFSSDYNLSSLKVGNINNNIILTVSPIQPFNMNYYVNTYRENDKYIKDFRESIILTTKKIDPNNIINVNSESGENTKSIGEVNQAFISSPKTQEESEINYITEDLTKNHKLRGKYYLFATSVLDDTFKITGVGSVCIQNPFVLDNPTRIVFDLPNTIINSQLHNKELVLANGDTIKTAQFTPTTTRVVVTSPDAQKYIPVFSSDSISVQFANPTNILDTHLPKYKANVVKFNYQKVNNIENFLVEFDKPLYYAVKKNSDSYYIYFLNAEKYNDSNFHSVIKNTPYSELSLHLLTTGMRLKFPTKNKENVNMYVSPDGKLFKLSSESVKVSDGVTTPDKIKKIIKKEGSITASPKLTTKNNRDVIVIDAGHGGKDCGALRGDITEKQINLAVCIKLQNILQKKGYKVYMTRTDDTYVSLEDRTLYTEGINPAAFVSVHVNSCNSDSPKGIETHYYHEESVELADAVHKNLLKKVSSTNRGLLKSRFYVINHTTVPAILVEIGFISNAEERQQLTTQARQQATAEGIAEGIIEFLKSLDK